MKGLLAGLLVLLVLPITAALAQGNGLNIVGYATPGVRDFMGGGARAMGMGSAFLGVSDDISSVGWNPAGLYRKNSPFEQPVLGLEYNTYKGDGEYAMDILQSHQVYDADKSADGWSMVSFLAPVRIKGHPFVLSGSFHRLDDEFLNGGYRIDTAYWYPVTGSEPVRVPYTTGMNSDYHSAVDALAVGFGTRLYNNISFGFAVNRYAGEAVFCRASRTVQDGVPTGYPPQSVDLVSDRVFIDTIAYSGLYFKGGLYYEGPRLSAGLIVSTPHKLVEMIDRVDSSIQYENGYRVDDDETETNYYDDTRLEIEQPMVIGGGVGYRLKPNLLVAADIEYRPYSGKELRLRDSLRLNPGSDDIEYYSTYKTDWNNAFAFRTGVEYSWHTGTVLFPTVPVRAGFGLAQVADPSMDKNLKTSTEARTSWSLGAGLHWQQVHLDFAYQHSSVSWDASSYAVVIEDLTVLSSEVNSTNNRFKVTFTGFF